jgi:hypothetical protein
LISRATEAKSARTKTEARRMELELGQLHERQRLGLEPLPDGKPEMTFGAAMDLWWSEHGRRLRSNTIRRFTDKHLRPELGPRPLPQVADRLESGAAADARRALDAIDEPVQDP